MSPAHRDPPSRVSMTVVLAAISLAAALLWPDAPQGAAVDPAPPPAGAVCVR